MTATSLTTPSDAYRMAYAGYMDGMDDAWHGLYAKAHGTPAAHAIFAALKAGRAQARADDAAYIASLTKPKTP
jgi:hypothetical protein